MTFNGVSKNLKRATLTVLLAMILVTFTSLSALAHPLGNFTVNHYSRLQINRDGIRIRFVVDMAEIPAFQALQAMDADGDGQPSEAEKKAYAEQAAARYAGGLRLTVDGQPVSLQNIATTVSTAAGNGGLPTLRLECDLASDIRPTMTAKRLTYEDASDPERAGWHEIVVAPQSSIAVFDSTAFGNGITDELKAYPEDRLSAPLAERRAEFSVTAGAASTNGVALKTREGRAVTPAKDRFAELIAVPELTVPVALLGLLIAAGLGALHALSPGHGKTVVGAYLVGSRGTAKHAAFLGLTVTITHTLGVFALGLLTLFASQYVLPERIFPVVSLISGVIVLFLGLSLFFKRLGVALGYAPRGHHGHDPHSHDHAHGHPHSHPHAHEPHAHTHDPPHEHRPHRHAPEVVPVMAPSHHHHEQEPHSHGQEEEHPHGHDHLHLAHSLGPAEELRTPDSELPAFTHTHDGHTHTHLPPGGDGSPITWKSLLALGISGGLLPCPSALVVMLSAVYLNRVGYGLFLVVAFSFGLAATLTAVGLLFLYAGRLLKRPARHSRWVQVIPVLSALVIACIGALFCYEALAANGFKL